MDIIDRFEGLQYNQIEFYENVNKVGGDKPLDGFEV